MNERKRRVMKSIDLTAIGDNREKTPIKFRLYPNYLYNPYHSTKHLLQIKLEDVPEDAKEIHVTIEIDVKENGEFEE